METLRQDLRYAVRAFRRAPGFALLAILTIAIGVGANTAIFSIVNAVLLRPLPFPSPDALMLLSHQDVKTQQNTRDASPANFLDWRARNHTFSGITAFRETAFATVLAGGTGLPGGAGAGDRPESVDGAMVTANFFDVLGVRPALGRAFQAADETPGAARVAVIGDGLWRRQFGARGDIVGQPIRINGETHTIVGVMPITMDYPAHAQVWVPPHFYVPDDPLQPTVDPRSQRGHGYIDVLGRLKPGVTHQQAQADMTAVAAALAREYPDANEDVGVRVASLHGELVGDVRPTLLILFASVGLLLLIATANVSGLLIARATGRQQEIALRLALGATRGRVVRQLITESLVLTLAGGVSGLLLAVWLVGPLVALAPSDLDIGGSASTAVHADLGLLLFGLAVSAIAGLLCGLAPARQLARVSLHDDLKQTARGGSSMRQQRVRSTLVAVEVALSLVLLVSAGLTIKSLIALQQVPPGFSTDRVLTFSINLPQARYDTAAARAAYWDRALTALRQIPGVDAAGAGSRLPLVPGNSSRSLTIEGRGPDGGEAGAAYRSVTPDYFRAMQIPVLRGRLADERDRADQPLVAMISASMAKEFWPGREAIGQRFARGSGEQPQWITVIGVVGDVRHASLEAAPRPTFYMPYQQDPWAAMIVAMRTTAADPTAIAGAVRAALRQIDPDQPLREMLTMDQRLASSLLRRRFSVSLLSAFGVLALGLAAMGLYGVLSFVVAQRRREIGIRMALGARAGDVIVDVLGQGMRLTAIGLIVGLALAFGAARLLENVLYGTTPTDLTTFASVGAILLVVAAAACALPAARASRVDPLVALKDE